MIRVHLLNLTRRLLIAPALAVIIAAVGCSRQIEVPTNETGTQTDQVPFGSVTSNRSESSSPAPDEQALKEDRLPFHQDSQTLPLGTLLTIRLEAPIAAGKSESFEGILDEPVVLHGKTVIPRGTLVSGRIEFASPYSVKLNRAYVRLALTSVQISGNDVPVRTASLFARQHNPVDRANPVSRLEKGHRLTFRLTEPLYAVAQTAQVSR